MKHLTRTVHSKKKLLPGNKTLENNITTNIVRSYRHSSGWGLTYQEHRCLRILTSTEWSFIISVQSNCQVISKYHNSDQACEANGKVKVIKPIKTSKNDWMVSQGMSRELKSISGKINAQRSCSWETSECEQSSVSVYPSRSHSAESTADVSLVMSPAGFDPNFSNLSVSQSASRQPDDQFFSMDLNTTKPQTVKVFPRKPWLAWLPGDCSPPWDGQG